MLLRRLIASSLVFAATTVDAQATIKFQATLPHPRVTAFGYYVGPFWGTVTSDPGRPVIDLYCVDILNQIRWGQSFQANYSNLGSGNLSQTRHGVAKLDQYRQAAYLASQFNAPGISTNQWGGIQAAMWNLLNPGYPNGGTNVNAGTTEAYWLSQASNWYNSSAARNFDFSKWTIVTDVNAKGVGSGAGVQEFLTTGVTPEPGTWVLMGTGVILIVGWALRRGSLV